MAVGRHRCGQDQPIYRDIKPMSSVRSHQMPSRRPPPPISPARRLRGRLRVPGDKSISHRYALLAALADGPSTLHQFCARRRLPVDAGLPATARRVDRGRTRPAAPSLYWDEVSGDSVRRPARSTPAIPARRCGCWRASWPGTPFRRTLVGDASLSRRPMRRVIEPLERMGARIEATDGHPPLTVHGARLHADCAISPTTPSAQVKSAVLLAGLHAEGVTTVTEPAATRDHTERALTAFGGDVSRRGPDRVRRGRPAPGRPDARRCPATSRPPPSGSSPPRRCPGSRVEIEDVGLNPTRTGAARRPAALRRARRRSRSTADEAGEPRGTVIGRRRSHRAIEIAPEEVPGLIDELPAIAALAAHGGEVTVRGAGELRVKESDRIAALVAGFRALGIDADERAGRLRHPRPSGSARRAASPTRAAITGWRWPSRSRRSPPSGRRRIDGADAVAISYPGFFETLRSGSSRENRQGLSGRLHGAGKTTVARALAQAARTGRRWTSTSSSSSASAQTVAEIFAKHGEPYFRAVERAGARGAARRRGTSSSRPAAARSSTRRTGRRSTATASRSGSTCRSSG